MQLTHFALPTLFLSSALAAPLLDLDRVVDLDDTDVNILSVDTSTVDTSTVDTSNVDTSNVDTSTVDGVVEADEDCLEKRTLIDLDKLVDLDDTALNVLSVDTDVVKASPKTKRTLLDLDNLVDLDDTDLNVLAVDTDVVKVSPEKRQAQPVISLVHGLLETTAPLAEQIHSALERLAGTDVAEGVIDLVTEDVGGLLFELVSEVESVVNNVAETATGSEKEDLAEIVGEVLTLVDGVVEEVEGALGGVLAIDNILSGLNDVLNGLVVALGGIVGGLLDALNLKLTQGGLSLTYVRVPVLGGLL